MNRKIKSSVNYILREVSRALNKTKYPYENINTSVVNKIIIKKKKQLQNIFFQLHTEVDKKKYLVARTPLRS